MMQHIDPITSASVILVHGTWGRGMLFRSSPSSTGTRWFENGSTFYSEMLAAIGGQHIDVQPFCWSGANSILARKKASVRLAELIDAQILSGLTDLLLIGHSHGGNVIVDAIPLVKGSWDRLTVITLATPFVSFNDKIQSVSEAALYYSGYFLLSILVTALLPLPGDAVMIPLLGLWMLYYRTEATLAQKLGVVDYEPKSAWSALRILALPMHFASEVFSATHIRFSRPEFRIDSDKTFVYSLRCAYDEAALVLRFYSFAEKWAGRLPTIAMNALLISCALLLLPLMGALSFSFNATLARAQQTEMSYAICVVEFAIFLVMFVCECLILTRLARRLEVTGLAEQHLPTIVAILRWLCRTRMRRYFSIVSFSAIALAVLVKMQGLLHAVYANSYESGWFSLGGLFVGFIAVLAVAYVSIGVLFLRLIVGPELFFRRLNASVIVGTTPAQIDSSLLTVESEGTLFQLRHFIYENIHCRRAVGQILQSTFRRSPTGFPIRILGKERQDYCGPMER